MVNPFRILTGLLSRFSHRSRRVHTRINCGVYTDLLFSERGYSVEGVVAEISRGGLRFRPGLTHILRRTGDAVKLSLGDIDMYGEIVRTYGDGYGVRFSKPISEAEIDTVLNGREKG